VVSTAAAGVFFAAATTVGEAQRPGIWGGAVWVFLLSMIVTLPLLSASARRRRPDRPGDRAPMLLTLAVGLCAVPFVLLLVGPLLGLRAAVGVSLALLAGITLVCWALCALGASREPTVGARR
jgi:hypothetical protein